MPYIPHTDDDRSEMLALVGLRSISRLFSDIPKDIRSKKLGIGKGISEPELLSHIEKTAAKNKSRGFSSFLGGGAYRHFIPAVVTELASRSEFYTAYTPYQAEASQGMLQTIYEYQTMIAGLAGLDVSNASMYDGATAFAEAALMAVRTTRRNEIVVDRAVNPSARRVLATYGRFAGFSIKEIACQNGTGDIEALGRAITKQTAAVAVQNPNFFGAVADYAPLAETAHDTGALLIVSAYPLSLGIVKPPGAMGADIAVGEAQCLGLPLSFGGPYLGFLAARKTLARRMPGRIVGRTVDSDNNPGFVLTLQTREQHIRREKATSNICSNQAHCALTATIYLAALGRTGLRKVAGLCLSKAQYLKKKLLATGAVQAHGDYPCFNEFVIELPCAGSVFVETMKKQKILAGIALGRYYPELEHCVLVTATELNTKAEIDLYVKKVKAAL